MQLDRRIRTIGQLSLLEVCMLASIQKFVKRVTDIKTPVPHFNFELVHDQYLQLVATVSRFGHGMGNLHFAKPVALKVILFLKLQLTHL